MKALILPLALCAISAFAQTNETTETTVSTNFDTYFEPKSLRVDFALSGNAYEQKAAVLQLREEPVWSGPKKNLIDQFGYGGYFVNVYDKASGQLIYSRGFNTLFEEWRTIEQAKTEYQSWDNSAIIPYPKNNVIVEITGRDKADMKFHSLLKTEVDPKSIFIDRGKLKENRVEEIQHKGNPTEKVDLVFVAEGYTAAEEEKFISDAKRFMDELFKTKPFDECQNDFNVWAVALHSEESGTDCSGKGVYKNTALNTGYYTFGVDRYLTTPNMKPIRDAVWNVPADAIFVLINTDTYGGGGMYNFYACGTAGHPKTPEVFTHEFGHSFAALADEYFSSEVAYSEFYNLDFEPWEANITTLKDFDSKWKDMLPENTPVPTPATRENKEKIGVYEGGGYISKGIYRPKQSCMMNDLQEFCPVCQRAIHRMVDYYCDRDYQNNQKKN